MNGIFFQSIGKPVRAVVTSLIRDVVCFTPIVIFLSIYFEALVPGAGINGIIYAAPISDFISIFVVVILTVTFFIKLSKKQVLNSFFQQYRLLRRFSYCDIIPLLTK